MTFRDVLSFEVAFDDLNGIAFVLVDSTESARFKMHYATFTRTAKLVKMI